MAEGLGVQDNVTECEVGWTPEPDRVIVTGEFLALLLAVMLAVIDPAVSGENVTFIVAFCPGARISPVDTPLVVNWLEEVLTLETITLEFPAFVRVTLKLPLPPMLTLPKFRLVGLALSREVAATPVALTLTEAAELDALLITETPPETLPVVFGENTTSKVDWLPECIVIGSDIPVIAKPETATLTWVTVRSDPPLFEMVTD